MPGRPDTYRTPDASFVRAGRIPRPRARHRALAIAPNLAVEVRSPSDTPGVLRRKLADYLDAGATGIVVHGTTGEPTALEDSEYDAVVAACARVCADRGAQCVVGAGTNSTRATIARHEALAGSSGVTGALTVVPYYVRPSETAIVTHFQAVAARSPVPLVVYNIPYRTGRALGATALLELAATDNIVGLKQAVGGIDTDTSGRALRADGSVIDGLYAAGNTSSPVMGHTYAGPGATIGPAMVFGYLAALDMAAQTVPTDATAV